MAHAFFEKLKAARPFVRFRATGAMTGDVLIAEPKDDTQQAKGLFAELMLLLGGGLTAAMILVFQTLNRASSSQILGITAAHPTSTEGSTIALAGYCLQARNKAPDPKEEYAIGEVPELPESRILAVLNKCDETLGTLSAYYFLEKISRHAFDNKFRQCGRKRNHRHGDAAQRGAVI